MSIVRLLVTKYSSDVAKEALFIFVIKNLINSMVKVFFGKTFVFRLFRKLYKSLSGCFSREMAHICYSVYGNRPHGNTADV